MHELVVLPEDAGTRLDVFVAAALPQLSRSAVQRLLEEGLVTRGGGPASKKDRCAPGDIIRVTVPEVREALPEPEDIPLDVRYEDDDVIVINKPRGLVVHPAAGHEDGTLVNALLYHCGDSLSGIGGEKRPGIVHRIDKDTSGLLIVAKNDLAHRCLSEQLRDHTMHRIYYAVVRGGFREDEGTVNAPIGRHPNDRKKMAVRPEGREAVTHYTVEERFGAYTMLRLRLETGRTHQIRVHMAYIGHSVVGDPVYGPKKEELGQTAQVLHAGRLVFLHPTTGAPVTVDAELPDYFLSVLSRLREKGR